MGTAVRIMAVALILTATSTCATSRLWLGPVVIDEYANVKVRIYRAAGQCRIEIIADNETIQTPITRCIAMPQRPRTN